MLRYAERGIGASLSEASPLGVEVRRGAEGVDAIAAVVPKPAPLKKLIRGGLAPFRWSRRQIDLGAATMPSPRTSYLLIL